METSLLATIPHIPAVRSELGPRPRLTGGLDGSLERKPTLIPHSMLPDVVGTIPQLLPAIQAMNVFKGLTTDQGGQ